MQIRLQCLLGLIAVAAMASASVPLDVPFIPQVPPPDSSVAPVATAWTQTRNCGQTSVLMVMSLYSGHKPVSQDIARIDDYLQTAFGDSVNSYYGSYTGGKKTNRLVSVATGFGATQAGQGLGTYPDTHAYSGWTLQQLQTELSAGHPVIVGVWTDMSIRVNKAGKATVQHWMVLTGITDIVYVNDPGHTYGKNNQYTLTDFEAAWNDQGNTVVVIHPSVPSPASPLWLSFIEGSPGTPGDGLFVNASGPSYASGPLYLFHPNPPIPFTQITDGLSLVVFPPEGTVSNVGTIRVGISAGATNKTCSSGFGIGPTPQTFSTVTVNGIQGAVVTFSRTTLQAEVTVIDQSAACGFTFDDFVISAITIDTGPTGTVVTTLDALAVGFSQAPPIF